MSTSTTPPKRAARSRRGTTSGQADIRSATAGTVVDADAAVPSTTGVVKRQGGPSKSPRKAAPRRKVEVDVLADKLVRDRFTMPAGDYDLIKLMKQRAAAAGRPTRKNELLRAGLHALRESGTIEMIKALDRLTPVRRKGRKAARDD